MSRDPDVDRVGYKRPPRHTQFQPGRSGNPSGRPKGLRNFRADLDEELSELLTVRDGDREIRITRQRALVRNLVAAAIKGDMRAVTTLVALCERGASGDVHDEAPEDQAIVREIDKGARVERQKNLCKE
jgi:Family of unknown function (DUF5681)